MQFIVFDGEIFIESCRMSSLFSKNICMSIILFKNPAKCGYNHVICEKNMHYLKSFAFMKYGLFYCKINLNVTPGIISNTVHWQME